VLAHCEGTSSTLASDSVAWFAGVKRFDMIGQKSPVHIRDTAMTLDAVNASYFLGQERLEAHKNVVTVNRKTGRCCVAQSDVLSRRQGCARHARHVRIGSTNHRLPRDADSGGGEPYIIVADRVRFKGTTGCGAAGR